MIYCLNERTDPFFNLAAEEFLLARSGPGESILLLWRNEPAVVVGRNQNTPAEVNLDEAQRRRIKVVRRLTGGGAVYHDLGNLNYSIITDSVQIKFDFRRFSAPILEVLANWSICARFSGRNDLVIEGNDGVARKFSGGAQGKIGEKLLHHGTLLFSTDFSAIGAVLTPQSGKFRSHAVESVQSRVTNLTEYLPKQVTLERFQEALIGAFRSFFGGDFQERSLSEEEVSAINEIKRLKYETWEWNIGKSPDADFSVRRRFSWGEITAEIRLCGGKIAECRFTGDFFAQEPVERFAESLRNLAFEPKTIRRAICGSQRRVWPEMTEEEFIAFLFDNRPNV